MSIGTALYSALTGDSTIAGLVSTRVYPVFLPQTPTLPAISYGRVSSTEQMGTTALRETRYQIDCWATSYAGAQALATAVKAAMEEWTDTDQTPGVKMARVANEIDDYESETELFRVSIDILCVTTGD